MAVIDVMKNTVKHKCNECKRESIIPLKPLSKGLRWLDEFNQYENYNLIVCKCGTGEVLNMNIPEDEYDISDHIPDDEWKARSRIKAIRRFLDGKDSEMSNLIPPKKKELSI